MWSFNRDGEVDEALKADFGAAFGIDEAEKRRNRRDLVASAHPQHGVDALRDAFPGSRPIEGVVDAGDPAARLRTGR